MEETKTKTQTDPKFKIGQKIRVNTYNFYVDGVECCQEGFTGKIRSEPTYNEDNNSLYYKVFRSAGGTYHIPEYAIR